MLLVPASERFCLTAGVATLSQYLADLDRRLDRIIAAIPVGEPGRRLHKRMLANRAHLFVFVTNRAVPCRIPTTSPSAISAPA